MGLLTKVFLLLWTCTWWWWLLPGVCHSLKAAAVSLWWLQDPCCI